MTTDQPILTASQEVYAALRTTEPERRPWEKLDKNQQRKYLIIGKHIVENYQPNHPPR